MTAHVPKFLRTDFGHDVYDEWYLKQGRYNFEAPEFVEKHFPFYEQALCLSKNDRILEAGCGIGSYTRAFARRGYHIVGMDLSPHFLSEARQITHRENLEIPFVLGDYTEMCFEAEFSVVFFEGAFFYRSEAGLMSLLNRIREALIPDGRLYFGHANRVVRNRRFPISKWSEIESGVFILEKGEYDADEDIERWSWLKIDLLTQKHYRCDYVCKQLPPDDLKRCLTAAGFTDTCFYKKRRLEDFQPNDDGFSVVTKRL